MKSAILNLLGISTSSSTFHTPYPSNNYGMELISDYVLNVHECALQPVIAAPILMKDLEQGFKNLLESGIFKQDTFIVHVGSLDQEDEKFDVVINAACTDVNLYCDYLADEISESNRYEIDNSFHLVIVMDVTANLQNSAYNIHVREIMLQSIKDSTKRCTLSDVLNYCFDEYTDMNIVRERLANALDMNHIFPSTAFSDAMRKSSLPA